MRLFRIFAALALLAAPAPVLAADDDAAAEAMQEYMEFSEYLAGIILPHQITEDIFKNVVFIDVRKASEFQAETIPGAVNIEWREVFARGDEIPEDKKVILFCNTGVLSAQAAFALRVAGRKNVLYLQRGLPGWKQSAPYKP